MLALASMQTTAFAGAGMAAPQMMVRASAPEMVARFGGAKKPADEFAYGLPGTMGFAPVNNPGFDPLGFAKDKSQDEVYRLREAEITHARVAMLACAGFLVQEKVHPLFSGDGGPAIEQIPALPVWVWGVMLAGIGNAEQQRIAKGFQKLDPTTQSASRNLREGYIPGDLGFDPANIRPKAPEKLRLMQERELANGRLAMMGAAGFLLQEALTGETWGAAWGHLEHACLQNTHDNL